MTGQVEKTGASVDRTTATPRDEVNLSRCERKGSPVDLDRPFAENPHHEDVDARIGMRGDPMGRGPGHEVDIEIVRGAAPAGSLAGVLRESFDPLRGEAERARSRFWSSAGHAPRKDGRET